MGDENDVRDHAGAGKSMIKHDFVDRVGTTGHRTAVVKDEHGETRYRTKDGKPETIYTPNPEESEFDQAVFHGAIISKEDPLGLVSGTSGPTHNDTFEADSDTLYWLRGRIADERLHLLPRREEYIGTLDWFDTRPKGSRQFRQVVTWRPLGEGPRYMLPYREYEGVILDARLRAPYSVTQGPQYAKWLAFNHANLNTKYNRMVWVDGVPTEEIPTPYRVVSACLHKRSDGSRVIRVLAMDADAAETAFYVRAYKLFKPESFQMFECSLTTMGSWNAVGSTAFAKCLGQHPFFNASGTEFCGLAVDVSTSSSGGSVTAAYEYTCPFTSGASPTFVGNTRHKSHKLHYPPSAQLSDGSTSAVPVPTLVVGAAWEGDWYDIEFKKYLIAVDYVGDTVKHAYFQQVIEEHGIFTLPTAYGLWPKTIAGIEAAGYFTYTTKRENSATVQEKSALSYIGKYGVDPVNALLLEASLNADEFTDGPSLVVSDSPDSGQHEFFEESFSSSAAAEQAYLAPHAGTSHRIASYILRRSVFTSDNGLYVENHNSYDNNDWYASYGGDYPAPSITWHGGGFDHEELREAPGGGTYIATIYKTLYVDSITYTRATPPTISYLDEAGGDPLTGAAVSGKYLTCLDLRTGFYGTVTMRYATGETDFDKVEQKRFGWFDPTGASRVIAEAPDADGLAQLVRYDTDDLSGAFAVAYWPESPGELTYCQTVHAGKKIAVVTGTKEGSEGADTICVENGSSRKLQVYPSAWDNGQTHMVLMSPVFYRRG